MSKRKYTHLIVLVSEELPDTHIVYGVSYNMQQEIHWFYNLKNNDLIIKAGLVNVHLFLPIIERLLKGEAENIKKGLYENSENRIAEVYETLTLNSLNKLSYLGEEE